MVKRTDDPSALAPGTVIGGHVLESLLGSGAFGAVFRAAPVHGGARVALKVMSHDTIDRSGGIERFRREARLVARLRHPNSVRVLDFGDDAGFLFIAFELLEGRTLEEALARDGAMSELRAAAIAAQILGALEEAHGANVIHRDIKPANVFLTGAWGRESVKLIDFGLAKSTKPNTLQGLTTEGATVGTPMYMAPEQIMGAAVGPTTDVFSLGIVLAEMLHGEPLYSEDTSPLLLMKDRILGASIPIPDVLADSPLRAIVERATKLDSALRFASAAEMNAAVLALAASLSMVVGSRTSGEATTRASRERETGGQRAPALAVWDEATVAAPEAPLAPPSAPPPPRVSPFAERPKTLDYTWPDPPSLDPPVVAAPLRRALRWRVVSVVVGVLGLVALLGVVLVHVHAPARAHAASVDSSEDTRAPIAPRHYFTDAATVASDCDRVVHQPIRIVNVLPHELRIIIEDPPRSGHFRQVATSDGLVASVVPGGAIFTGAGTDLDLDAIDFTVVPRLVRDAETRAGSPGATTAVSVSQPAGEPSVIFVVLLTAPPGGFPPTFKYDAAGRPLAR